MLHVKTKALFICICSLNCGCDKNCYNICTFIDYESMSLTDHKVYQIPHRFLENFWTEVELLFFSSLINSQRLNFFQQPVQYLNEEHVNYSTKRKCRV